MPRLIDFALPADPAICALSKTAERISFKHRCATLARRTGCASTLGTAKQLLPIHDKRMIYHLVSVLMMAAIREIIVITTAEDQPASRRLLGDGERPAHQLAGKPTPTLLLEALLEGRPSIPIPGDNLLHETGFEVLLSEVAQTNCGTTAFAQLRATPKDMELPTWRRAGQRPSRRSRSFSPHGR